MTPEAGLFEDYWGYEVRGGMRIPLAGEVAWELPEGPWPYWCGDATEITYEFTR